MARYDIIDEDGTITSDHNYKKSFQVVYKFSDVTDMIEATTKEEALKIANSRLMGDYNPQNDTRCYDIEVEEDE